MEMETIFTTIIPIILIAGIIIFNLRKMQKNINELKKGCGGGCAGCAQSKSCNKAEKDDK